ncbi:DEAD/DEAH box helicase [Massilia sp. HP4]|uniref:DEAD/DEAH box helicase n=1 Tax=Massilia sp. HP4 TaxID=2562316 RepID=UPI0010C0325A|nr:DEAD/DEAH box helicase [Massilia sp. HP4]
MYFDHADLSRNFDAGTLQRGEDYTRKGKVRSARRDDDKLIGEVGGSGGELYRQAIRFKSGRGGIDFHGSCSCPMSYNCKHVVAVLLVELERYRHAMAQSPAASAARAEAWLQDLALLSRTTLAQAAANPGAASTLAWVLVPEPAGGPPRLHLRRARLRKNGGFNGTTPIHDVHALLRASAGSPEPGDDESLRLFAALQAGDIVASDAMVSGAIGARLLTRLCAEDQLLLAWSDDDLRRNHLFCLQPGPRREATLGWRSSAGDDAAWLDWSFDDGSPMGVLPTDPPLYLGEDTLGELALRASLAALPPAALVNLVAGAPRLQAEQRAGMAAQLAALGLDHLVPPPQAVETRLRGDVVPTPWLVLDSIEAGWGRNEVWHDHAHLSFEYDGHSTEDVDGPVLRSVRDGVVELIERDPVAEAAAAAVLSELGFRSPPTGSPLDDWPGVLTLADEGAWLAFASQGVARLQAAGWQIEMEDNYRFDLARVDDWYAELDEEDEGGNAWFSLELGIVVGGERHALLPLLVQMVRAAPRDFAAAALAARGDDQELLVELTNFERVALPWGRVKPILATLGELYFGERLGNGVRLPAMDAARLAELERAARLRWIGGERLRELGRKLDSFGGIQSVTPPAGLQAALRPYQLGGLAWLQFLREYGFGGILADDMGLGKTIQTLAHILLEKEAGRLDAPALVVAPTSLMPNWQAEAARFAPGLRVLLLHGKERVSQFDAIGEYDLVLTTYALLGRDEDALRRHRYHLLILDEAQYIKNSRAKAAQTARLLDARHRLCLTGTPVQNHLGELWSQFHFLMPGLLGDERSFKANYRKPIEQGGDTLRQDFLVRRVKPFMLRRTKDKVATELPPKSEILLPVELCSAQRDLYETVRVAMDRKVRAEIDRKGLARSHIVILEALLKLRQVCCDPRLVEPASETGSAKLDTLMELLDTLTSEGRKVLVFSQFTSMLSLIGAALQARGVDFVELTGSTLDRAAPVAAFQEGKVGVFLISLKAGGVGLNLTAADTVIHYDPWWNPASENQATDRAWRIGQQQPVFVYKLIARGTLEEKIQELQRRKGELANAVLSNEGESELAPGLQADDLRAIFSLAPPGQPA